MCVLDCTTFVALIFVRVETLGTHHEVCGYRKNRGFGKKLAVTSADRANTSKTRRALSPHGNSAILQRRCSRRDLRISASDTNCS